jgi:quercetin dioxygenase-like cupin family protein
MSAPALTNLNETQPMPEGGIASKPLVDLAGSTKVVLFALDQGQEITPHTAPFPAEVIVLEGRLDVLVGKVTQPVVAHQVIDLPAGMPHGLCALEPSRFLLIMRRGAQAAAGKDKDEACASHGCSHQGAEPGPSVQHPVLLQWMAEHEVAGKQLNRMEQATRRRDWEAVREGALWLYTELKVHNEAEETYLFPLMDPLFGGSHGPTACMREEHRSLWDLTLMVLGDITDGAARNPDSCERMSLQLIATLRSHIEKENNVLYPMAERMLDAATLEKLNLALTKA